MKHFILVKFNRAADRAALLAPIQDLFHRALKIEGVSSVDVRVSNTDLANRHDLMIEMSLTPAALQAFDRSELHKLWKDMYGTYITDKVIFDCD